MKRRGEEEDESGKESEIEVPYLELPNATPLGAAFHVADSFCEVPASRDAQVDTQLLRQSKPDTFCLTSSLIPPY